MICNLSKMISASLIIAGRTNFVSSFVRLHGFSTRSQFHFRVFSSSGNAGDKEELEMGNIYREWTVEQDQYLYQHRHHDLYRLASKLGRGLSGTKLRLEKLTNINSPAYQRLFLNNIDDEGESGSSKDSSKRLTPVKDILHRIQWDYTLDSKEFSILYYDRLEDKLMECDFDAPNENVKGKEKQFIFAIPEHRIEKIKYRERIIWDKELRIDYVFGSGSGTIQQRVDDPNVSTIIVEVIETYDEWKREKYLLVKQNLEQQKYVSAQIKDGLGEMRFQLFKEQSNRLLSTSGDLEAKNKIEEYVRFVMNLFRDSYDLSLEEDDTDEDLKQRRKELDSISIELFSQLVAFLPDKHEQRKEEILLEIMSFMEENNLSISYDEEDDDSESTGSAKGNQKTNTILVLPEDELDEQFVKGGGKGGQKVNKTANKVVLTHIPTNIKIECQDTRSLQQNRKIARKRLRLKVDMFLNGKQSILQQKQQKQIQKKQKRKSRNKARQRKREQEKET